MPFRKDVLEKIPSIQNPDQRKALEFILGKGEATSKEVASAICCDTCQARSVMNQLVKKSLVRKRYQKQKIAMDGCFGGKMSFTGKIAIYFIERE